MGLVIGCRPWIRLSLATRPYQETQWPPEATPPPWTSPIVTTDEELEAFMIVRAISAKLSPVERVAIRDAKSYCAVLMDDNNRRPICRFYFNSATTKYLGVFDSDKKETKHKISAPSEIYQFADSIEAVVRSYAE